MKNSKTETTLIGEIINTFGIKGEVKIRPYTDNIKRFSKLTYVLLGEDKEELAIESVRYNKDFVYLKFKNFNNINDVLAFKNSLLYIYDEDREKLPKGKYYISDLIGKKCYKSSGEYLGILEKVEKFPACDVLVIVDGEITYNVPNVSEFVKDISQDIIVDPIEGMRLWKFQF